MKPSGSTSSRTKGQQETGILPPLIDNNTHTHTNRTGVRPLSGSLSLLALSHQRSKGNYQNVVVPLLCFWYHQCDSPATHMITLLTV